MKIHFTKSSQTSQMNAVFRYDFTRHIMDETELGEIVECTKVWCKDYCKDWVFQAEKGKETGRLHLQGRICLKERIRLNQLVNLCKSTVMEGSHWSPTANATGKRFDYVMKEDTRVSGPWGKEIKEVVPKKKPSSVEHVEKCGLRPWQEKLREMSQIRDQRCIDIIYDKKGNMGKTVFVKYMMYYDLALYLPDLNNTKDLIQTVGSDMKKNGGEGRKCYIFDLPRATDKKEKFAPFYRGIESIKSGVVFETRYEFESFNFDEPRVFVFTNYIPNLSYLSEDRWRFWKLAGPKDNEDLVSFDPLAPEEEHIGEIQESDLATPPSESIESEIFPTVERMWDFIFGTRDDPRNTKIIEAMSRNPTGYDAWLQVLANRLDQSAQELLKFAEVAEL